MFESIMPKKKLISVVVPAFNEEECVDELARRLRIVADDLSARYTFEFIIIENGSADTTYEKLLAIHSRDSRFKILRLSRNFGIEGAVTAGLRKISGDAAIIMCADLQDPPEMLSQFIERWEAGYDMVYGIVARRTDEGKLRQVLTRVFYWMLNRLNEQPVPRNVSDFRLVDRKVYEALNGMHEKNRMLRAMWGWLGFNSTGIEYTRPPRHGGKSTYHIVGNILFALHGIMSSTTTPLKIIPIFGLALSSFSFVMLFGFVIRWLVAGVPFGGFGTIVALMLLLFGLLFLLLGMLSEYVGIIYQEVRNRPSFVASEAIGFDVSRRDEDTYERIV